MRSEAEEKALQELLRAVALEKTASFDYMVSVTKLTPKELTEYGYKSIPDGLYHVIQASKRKIDNLHKAFIRQFPD